MIPLAALLPIIVFAALVALAPGAPLREALARRRRRRKAQRGAP